MGEDVFTEVTEESWFGRIGSSITGVLVGIVMIIGASGLLFWNEGRTIKTHKSLAEGAGIVKSIDSSKVDELNDGRLVHITGRATTTQVLKDGKFPVAVTALTLKRTVRMYQWREAKQSEKKKKTGGGEETVTTYTYEKGWSESLINSSGFKKSAAHANPQRKPVESRVVAAESVTLGAFILPGGLVRRITSFEPVPVESLPDSPGQMQLSDNGYYIGKDEDAPEIGDVKIAFAAVMPTNVTLVAQQNGNSFTPYTTSIGGQIEELSVGSFSAADMFKNAQSSNTLLSWGLRFLGALLMMVGFVLLFNPLAVIADVIPFVGNIVEFGTGIMALLVTLILSVTVVAFAWVFYRPVVAALLVGGAAVVVFFAIKVKTR